MSLHDIDKGSADRGAPRPNHRDFIAEGANKAHGTTSVNYNTDSSPTTASSLHNGFFTIVGSDILPVSLTGFTGTAGVYTLSSASSQVAHGLPYTPMVMGYLNVNSGSTYLPMPYTALNNFGAGPTWTTYSVSVDSTYVTFNIRLLMFGAVTTTDSTVNLRYYLLKESAS